MPELPEVETTRRGIEPRAAGRRIVSVHVYDARLRWPVPSMLPALLDNARIVAVERRSKYLLFRMTSPAGAPLDEATMLVHLGMTGSLRVHRCAPARTTHDHVDLVFDDGTTLRYRDPRRFGTILWIPGDAAGHPLLARLIELIREATHKPAPRVKTKVSRAAKKRRVDDKKRHGTVKSLRRARSSDD